MRRLAFLIFLILIISRLSAAGTDRTVTVGYYENTPLAFTGESSKVEGVFPELLELIAKKRGWNLRYKKGDWEECLYRLERGEIDLLAPIAVSDERRGRFEFNKETVLINYGMVYTRKGEQLFSIFELQNKKVAVLRDDIHFFYFKEILKKFQVSVNYLYCQEYREVFENIKQKKADCGIVNRLLGLRLETEYPVLGSSIIFNPIEVRLAAPKHKSHELLNEIDKELAALKADKKSAYFEILNKWLAVRKNGGAVPVWIFWVLIGAAVLIGLFAFHNFVLKKRVRVKTFELEAEKKKLKREIDERKQTEAALVESEAKFRNLFETMAQGVVYQDGDGRIIAANPSAQDILGLTLEQMQGRTSMDPRWRSVYLNGEDYPGDNHPAMIALRTGRPVHNSIMGVLNPLKDEKRWINVHSIPEYRDGEEKPFRVYSSFDDITLLINTERAFREAQLRYQVLFEKAGDAIFILRVNGSSILIGAANQAAAEMYGRELEDLLDMDFTELESPESPKRLVELAPRIELGEWIKVEVERRKKDGSVFPVEMSAGLIELDGDNFILAFDRDISDRKLQEKKRLDLEMQLRQSQKMEALGRLASGIAHDFNNVLGAVHGYAELTLLDMDESDVNYGNLQQVLKASRRARDLVSHILAFSRSTESKASYLNIRPIIKETIELLRASLPATIEIRSHTDVESDIILADPTQIHQILMNLCTNAGYAMQEKGGVLDIELTEVNIGRDPLYPTSNGKEGNHLRLTVRDNGIGMSRATLDRIFEPYFTKREAGQGTGLGLSVVNGIVMSLGGWIEVESELNKGTAFHVFLRLFSKYGPNHNAESLGPPPLGSESIMFVDDEKALADLGAEILEKLGYKASRYSSSLEALHAFKAAPERFDLIITDQTMPGLTGLDLARAVRKIKPQIPIILCTGFSSQISKENLEDAQVDKLLMKPLSLRELAENLRFFLDKKKYSDNLNGDG